MPTIPMRIVATVERRADACLVLHAAGDAALVSRGYDRLLVLRCPCGCGDDVVINLDRAAGPAWSMYRSTHGASVYPSVQRESGCGSHFIIWDDAIHLFAIGWHEWAHLDADGALEHRVLRYIRAAGRTTYPRLAEQIGEVPWNVLAACRRLVETGLLAEIDDVTFEPCPVTNV